MGLWVRPCTYRGIVLGHARGDGVEVDIYIYLYFHKKRKKRVWNRREFGYCDRPAFVTAAANLLFELQPWWGATVVGRQAIKRA